MFQIGKLIVQGLVATFGTSAIAANAIANTIASFINTPGTAIQLGLTTVVGQCVGGRDYEQAVYYTRKLLWLTYGLMGVLNIAVFLVAGPLVGLFHLSAAAAADARAVLYTFTVASILIWPLSFSLPNALRAAGDARFTMIVSMVSMWVFRIGFSYLLGGAAKNGPDGRLGCHVYRLACSFHCVYNPLCTGKMEGAPGYLKHPFISLRLQNQYMHWGCFATAPF